LARKEKWSPGKIIALARMRGRREGHRLAREVLVMKDNRNIAEGGSLERLDQLAGELARRERSSRSVVKEGKNIGKGRRVIAE
jgi:hypothetical protein